MNNFYGYIRVSTAKQGEGVSLQEQRAAIEGYARRNNWEIADWFEEKETAAKRGRPVFSEMLKLLRQGKARGVIIHKIDRSARNLKDWADLGELIDAGVEIHFANEGLDLHSRGGRLSADIQAVVAADYIRNLKEEARKGFYGRLKQGIWPVSAPLGYLDTGAGNPKKLDPVRAPLIRQAFDLYASGRYGLETLSDEMFLRGLRNSHSHRVNINSWSVILNNPFYMGLIRVRKTGETFDGKHEPLIRKTTFDRVQAVLKGKLQTRTLRHEFVFRRLFRCALCGLHLIGERQKGHVYYRCHTKGCPMTGVREEAIDEATLLTLAPLQWSENEEAYFRDRLDDLKRNWQDEKAELVQGLRFRQDQIAERLNRLTDALIDGVISKEAYEPRKAALLREQKDVEEKRRQIESGEWTLPKRLEEILELAGSAYLHYELANDDEKREFLQETTSNRSVSPNGVEITLLSEYATIAERAISSWCPPHSGTHRTLETLWGKLVDLTSAKIAAEQAATKKDLIRTGGSLTDASPTQKE